MTPGVSWVCNQDFRLVSSTGEEVWRSEEICLLQTTLQIFCYNGFELSDSDISISEIFGWNLFIFQKS